MSAPSLPPDLAGGMETFVESTWADECSQVRTLTPALIGPGAQGGDGGGGVGGGQTLLPISLLALSAYHHPRQFSSDPKSSTGDVTAFHTFPGFCAPPPAPDSISSCPSLYIFLPCFPVSICMESAWSSVGLKV